MGRNINNRDFIISFEKNVSYVQDISHRPFRLQIVENLALKVIECVFKFQNFNPLHTFLKDQYVITPKPLNP